MTSSPAAGRLTSVLQGGSGIGPPNKSLTRQQTFPPPQPYVRMRYMSATVEMSTCTETVVEGAQLFKLKFFFIHFHTFIADDSRSQSSHGSYENISSNFSQQYNIPSIAVLSPNNSRGPDLLLPEIPASKCSVSRNKREQENSDKEKPGKMVKLSEDAQLHEKENLDPKKVPTNVCAIVFLLKLARN